MKRFDLNDGIVALGMAMLATGIGLMSVPWMLIVCGALLLAVGLASAVPWRGR